MTALGQCLVCGDPMPGAELLDHIRVMHPDEYGDGPERWPDGGLVITGEPETVADMGGGS